MRNSGWYIPYWRKPKKKGRQDKPSNEEITRSDEQLDAVRHRWIERYRRTARALRVLGLSIGSNRGDVQARYEALRAAGTVSARDLEDAYRHLIRALPAQERRKRRPQPANESSPSPRSRATADVGAAATAPDQDTSDEAADDEGDEVAGDDVDDEPSWDEGAVEVASEAAAVSPATAAAPQQSSVASGEQQSSVASGDEPAGGFPAPSPGPVAPVDSPDMAERKHADSAEPQGP